MALTPYQNQVLADGAVGYWPLNEKTGLVATDIVGGQNGTIAGGVTLGQPGPLPDGTTGMLFDGTTGKITLPSLTPAAAFSLEIWVKRVLSGTDQPLFQIGNSPFYILGSGTSFFEQVNNGVVVANGTVAINDTLWHACVSTYSAGSAHLYLDGVDCTGTTFTHVTSAAVGFIGSSVFTQFAKATLKDAAWYNTILTPAQVKNHYNTFRLSGPGGGPITTGLGGQLNQGALPILGGAGNFS